MRSEKIRYFLSAEMMAASLGVEMAYMMVASLVEVTADMKVAMLD